MPLECVNLASGYDVTIALIFYWAIKSTKLDTFNNNCIENACIYELCTRICKPVRSLIEIHALLSEKSRAESLNQWIFRAPKSHKIVSLSSILSQFFVASQKRLFSIFCDCDIQTVSTILEFCLDSFWRQALNLMRLGHHDLT